LCSSFSSINRNWVAHETLLPVEDGDGRGQEKSMLSGAARRLAEDPVSVYFTCGEKEAKPLGFPNTNKPVGGIANSIALSGIVT